MTSGRVPTFTTGALLCVLMCFPAAGAQTPRASNERPREHFQNSEVIYDWVDDSHGNRLRTFVTHPKNSAAKVPTLFFVGWLSCDSVEYPNGETDGFGAIFWRLIETSGFATMRMDKQGVGESGGTCEKTDYLTELNGYRAAFASLSKYPFIDSDRVFIVGLSNGGGTSPLIPLSRSVHGYIVVSSWGRTWYEHMLELERVRLSARKGTSAAEINTALKGFTDFYSLYLLHKMTPGEILKQHPEWKALWYDAPDGQYGRPAAFYQQLQDLNLGETWAAVNVPVLVLRGSADTIMSHSDSIAVADIVNRTHPGRAEYMQIPNADHLLSVHEKLVDSAVPTILSWIKGQLR
jgi:pimeloyl-ACP methyl ester carboxylesterase